MSKTLRSSPRVVLAGGGVAALEAALALRAALGERVSITMLAPERDLVYRPLSVGEPFALTTAARYPLDRVANDLDIALVHEPVASVVPDAHLITTMSGAAVPYDALFLALGAARERVFEHAVTFAGAEDSESVRGVVCDLEQGYTRRIVFLVPPGTAWSLPLYELALMMARRAYEMGIDDAELTLATPEERALAVFGADASRSFEELLAGGRIGLHTGVYAQVPANGRVTLHPAGERLDCDRIVALPVLKGRRLPGVPHDPDGFVTVDPHGRVQGVDAVYAAGDMTTFPVKQGGIACEQADAAAAAIARQLGADVEPHPFNPVLRGRLMTGGTPRYLRNDLRGGEGDVSTASSVALWWPPGKIAGKYLAPYLARLEGGKAPIRRRFVVTAGAEGTGYGAFGLDV